MQRQKAVLEAKMKDELIATKMPPLSLQIIELIKSRGPTSIGEAVAAIDANRNTVKVHFRNLVIDGYLEKRRCWAWCKISNAGITRSYIISAKANAPFDEERDPSSGCWRLFGRCFVGF